MSRSLTGFVLTVGHDDHRAGAGESHYHEAGCYSSRAVAAGSGRRLPEPIGYRLKKQAPRSTTQH